MEKFSRYLMAPIILASISSSGCIPHCREYIQPREVLEQKIEDGRGLIVGIEGLQPYSDCLCTSLSSRLAKEFGLALSASSGDWGKHVPFIEKAYEKGDKIILIGFSAGTQEIWNIANRCKNDIAIDLFVYLDPTHKNNLLSSFLKIPSNVSRAVIYLGENSCWFGGRPLNENDFESSETSFENYIIPEVGHLDLPRDEMVYDSLRKEVLNIFNK